MPTRSCIACPAGRIAAALFLIALTAGFAQADLPRFSAAGGTGIGGLFHREYVSGAPKGSEVGHFSARLWWADLAWSFRSRMTLGLRAHFLRVPLHDTPDVGTLDLVPVVLQLGYWQPALNERLYGFVCAGAGLAAARFYPSDADSAWVGPGGDPVDVSHDKSFVFEISVGGDYSIGESLLLELGLVTSFTRTEVAYQSVPRAEDPPEFTPDRAFTVKGRHLLLTLGVRWWFEWW